MKKKILFVCLGNICRSPMAEGVMKHLVEQAGLEDEFIIDSAGTAGYHQGELADPRMRTHASQRGYTLTHRSRKVTAEDFYDFDYIIAMDDYNVADLEDRAPSVELRNKIYRMADYASQHTDDHVPDPYYGGDAGFEHVIDLLEDACDGLLKALTQDN